MTLIIRKAKEDDIAAISVLCAQQQKKEGSVEKAKAVLAKMNAYPNYTVFVALKDSAIIAAFSLLIMDNLAHEGAPGGVMDDLIISFACNTPAVATKIMDFALYHCDELHCYKLCVPNHHSLVQELLSEHSYFDQHGRSFVMDLVHKEALKKPFSLLNNGLALREAEAADLPHILDLYKQPGMDDKTLSVSQAALVYEKMKSYPDYRIYVVLAERAIIGTFALLIAPSLTSENQSLGVVEDVMVSPSAQGKGVGKFMMQCALQVADKKGCSKLILSSNIKREAAHAFYLALGFVELGASFLMTPKLELCSRVKPALKLGL